MLAAGAVFCWGSPGWLAFSGLGGGSVAQGCGLLLEKIIHIDANSLCTCSLWFSFLALAGWHLPDWGCFIPGGSLVRNRWVADLGREESTLLLLYMKEIQFKFS